jgi:hypothetical protein
MSSGLGELARPPSCPGNVARLHVDAISRHLHAQHLERPIPTGAERQSSGRAGESRTSHKDRRLAVRLGLLGSLAQGLAGVPSRVLNRVLNVLPYRRSLLDRGFPVSCRATGSWRLASPARGALRPLFGRASAVRSAAGLGFDSVAGTLRARAACRRHGFLHRCEPQPLGLPSRRRHKLLMEPGFAPFNRRRGARDAVRTLTSRGSASASCTNSAWSEVTMRRRCRAMRQDATRLTDLTYSD